MFHLPSCGGQTRIDLLCGFRSTLQQTPAQFLEIGRHDEYIGQSVPDHWIAAVANNSSALRIDVDQNILSAL